MTRAVGFQPDWACPPGETISEMLEVQGLELADFAANIGSSIARVHELIGGITVIDGVLAQRLESALGASAKFWMQRELQYREDVARLGNASKVPGEDEFLSKIPISDMRRFGWIDAVAHKSQKLGACLSFFGVPDLGEWQRRYNAELAVTAFRTSPSFEANPYAVLAWLRRAELTSELIDCQPWNAELFASKLDEIKGLSRIKEPSRFVPMLRMLCAECGVSVAIARAPKGCRASGATRFLNPAKALIVLSFRYRSDDQFWFTFFHEAAHLILHGQDALFLEDGSDVTEKEEAEANEYAARVLIPQEFVGELMALRPQVKQIVAFARKVGVSPGIVVGQLQHLGRVRRNRLNGFKRRYQWDELSNLDLSP